jgi:hypothetical protein
MFLHPFRRHAALIKCVFQGVSSEEQQRLELRLRKIGKRAKNLAQKKSQSEIG